MVDSKTKDNKTIDNKIKESEIKRPRNDEEIKEYIIYQLRYIFDPEIPVNIYDLGLIYEINLKNVDRYKYCTIVMTLTSPGCPVADSLINQVEFYTKSIPEIDEVRVNVVFSPPWDVSKVTQEGRDILELEGTVVPQY